MPPVHTPSHVHAPHKYSLFTTASAATCTPTAHMHAQNRPLTFAHSLLTETIEARLSLTIGIETGDSSARLRFRASQEKWLHIQPCDGFTQVLVGLEQV